MRAIGVTQYGGPDALRVLDLPEPHAGPGQVRVRVRAAAVNPTDTLLRDGTQRARQEGVEPPYVPGMDLAGVLDEVGDGAAGPDGPWAVGDEVVGIVVPDGAHGAYAEQVVLPAASIARRPAGTSWAQAASLPMNALTARLALDLLAVPAGGTIGVTGAAGAFGGYVVQLAAADGLRVVADASDADRDLVAALGAQHVVARGDDVADRFREVVPAGLDAVADGALLHDLVAPALHDGGGLAVVRGWDGDPGRGIAVHRVFVGSYAERGDLLDRLRAQVEDGTLTLRVAGTVPAADAASAHRRLEAGGVRGRLVLEL